ncbi:MAG: hypothetical protein HeimC2_25600 [Candidatus Heimdallarchaeota archaeon LC_2]|nr:MAG: hypothetical protein HeimC2_25600 [Candidatus Heimdallarchaeota archaeon LC_2]
MKKDYLWLFFGGIFAGLGVAFGAFGAHILENRLSDDDFSIYETAIQYQMYHAFALLILYAVSHTISEQKVRIIGWSFVLGIVLFSGSLYLYIITSISIFGAITPFGGVSFLFGWITLSKEGYIVLKNEE